MTKEQTIIYVLSENDIRLAIFKHLSDKFKENNIIHSFDSNDDIKLNYDGTTVLENRFTAKLTITSQEVI